MIKTPITNHIDIDKVYEPAEDSFLLLDALEQELEYIRDKKPVLCLEIGSGSGIISTGLASVLPSSLIFACDINPNACFASKRTAEVNNTTNQSIVQMDFLSNYPFLDNKIDLIICNPPYVATNEDELGHNDIYASWAGGKTGRHLTDHLIKCLPNILSDIGTAYIVLEQCNKPEEVKKMCQELNFHANFVLSRRAGREHLYVLKLNIK